MPSHAAGPHTDADEDPPAHVHGDTAPYAGPISHADDRAICNGQSHRRSSGTDFHVDDRASRHGDRDAGADRHPLPDACDPFAHWAAGDSAPAHFDAGSTYTDAGAAGADPRSDNATPARRRLGPGGRLL